MHPVQARDALLRYLRSSGLEPANRQTAEGQVRYLETLIATLLVTTQLEGAELRVDDQVMDATTLARGVPLMAGAHRLTLQANGTTFSRFVVLRGGERTHLELPAGGSIALSCAVPQTRFFIDDQEVDSADAARGVPRSAGSHRVAFKAGTTAWPEQPIVVSSEERVSVVCARPPAAVESVVQPGMKQRGYWVTGAGLSLAIAALATGIYNSSQYDRWQTTNDDLRENQTKLEFDDFNRQAQENDQLRESILTRRRVAIGLGIAGGLVTAGGVALLFHDSAASTASGAGSWPRKLASGLRFSGAIGSGEIAWRGAW